MFSKSSWQHLRIPFSFFLMPVYLFALAISDNVNIKYAILVFISLHIFLYPASNGYNSYFDKDEKSIGGLKNPPKVNKGLYYLALLFDVIALLIGCFNWGFMALLFIYGLVSKAYSHPSIRIKKYPYWSWFIAGLFQGTFTFLMAYIGINNVDLSYMINFKIIIPAFLTSLMLWGSYPMTQVYQHEEDSRRGDFTLSIKLGIRGTFYFTMTMFTIASLCFAWYFTSFYDLQMAIIYLLAMSPVVLFFFYWLSKVLKDIGKANFDNTMRLNAISAFCLNGFFIYLFLSH